MALVITTWLWGHYGEHYARRLANSVHRNLTEAHRFLCFTDTPRHLPEVEQHPIRDMELTRVKGCFARLRLFDPEWQHKLGINPGDRVVNLDLDLVVTGELDPLFTRKDDFTILTGINSTNPNPFNGSVWMLKAGARPDVWDDFSLETAQTKTKIHAFADDQGWFEYKMPNAGAWGPSDGVYGFKKVGWKEALDEQPKKAVMPGHPLYGSDESLPWGARIVAFPGWRDPSKFEHLGWVKAHWR